MIGLLGLVILLAGLWISAFGRTSGPERREPVYEGRHRARSTAEAPRRAPIMALAR